MARTLFQLGLARRRSRSVCSCQLSLSPGTALFGERNWVLVRVPGTLPHPPAPTTVPSVAVTPRVAVQAACVPSWGKEGRVTWKDHPPRIRPWCGPDAGDAPARCVSAVSNAYSAAHAAFGAQTCVSAQLRMLMMM